MLRGRESGKKKDLKARGIVWRLFIFGSHRLPPADGNRRQWESNTKLSLPLIDCRQVDDHVWALVTASPFLPFKSVLTITVDHVIQLPK